MVYLLDQATNTEESAGAHSRDGHIHLLISRRVVERGYIGGHAGACIVYRGEEPLFTSLSIIIVFRIAAFLIACRVTASRLRPSEFAPRANSCAVRLRARRRAPTRGTFPLAFKTGCF
jgi:hypothetical protein